MATAWRLGVLRESSKATRLNFYPVWVACSHSLISGTHLTRRDIGRLRPLLCVLRVSLSRTLTTLVLCRSLAGVNQRITLPLFYSVIILQIISSSLIVTVPLYHNWVGMSSVYCTLFHSFLRVFYCSPPTFPCRCNTFIITYYPDLSRGCPRGGAHRVGCTDLTTHLSHGLC